MKRMHAALLALVLLTAPACGFVRDVVQDPLGTALGPFDNIPFFEEAAPYVFDGILNGAFNVLVLTLVVLDEDNVDLDEHPGWICVFACDENDPPQDAHIGYVSCENCETSDGIYMATGDAAIVVTEGDWRVAEFDDDNSNAFVASFDASGDTRWTWTDGEQEIDQPIFVRDAADIAAFDLASDAEVERIEIAVGESIDLELLPVDAEGHVLAANYIDVSFANAVATSERVSFVNVEGWDDAGTIARITGSAPGESSFVVRCVGAERTFEIIVR